MTATWNSMSRDYFFHAQNAIAFGILADATGDVFNITVTDSASGAVLTAGGVDDHPSYELDDHHTGAAELAAGQTARIRLTRTTTTPGAEYTIAVLRVRLAPEILAPFLAIGDTVNGETMANAVDVDRFYTRNTSGAPAELALFFQSRAGFLYLSVLDSTTGAVLSSGGYYPDPTPRPVPFVRLAPVLLQSGQTVMIQALQFGAGSGPYQLWLYPVDRGPEHLPAAIALNDTITGEDLENNADEDRFTVTVPAGAELIGYYKGPGNNIHEIGMSIQGGGMVQPVGVGNQFSTTLEELNTGRFTVPTGGTLTVTHGLLGGDFPVQHAYSFMLRTIDRQPEQSTAGIAVGDSIGESLDYIGDIDEFTFTGVTNQTVTVSIRALSGFPFTSIELELVDPTGTAIGVATSMNGAVGSSGAIQLQLDGTYTVRILSQVNGVGAGAYEALVQ